MKVVPYAALGQLDGRTLLSAVALLPPAMVAVLSEAAVMRRMKPAVCYPLMLAMAAYAGQPLIVDDFGGIKWVPEGESEREDDWGYGEDPRTEDAFLERLEPGSATRS